MATRPINILREERDSSYHVTDWDEFIDYDFDWQQGEHVTLIGTTGQGKTTLELQLVGQRDFVMFLGTKSKDDTQDDLKSLGFRWAKTVKEVVPDVSHKWVINPGVDPKETASEMKARHREVYREAIMYAYHTHGWSLFIDEGRYICDYLNLRDEIVLVYLQGRSQDISVVMGTQRPAWVPREVFDAATHLFFWKDNDHRNIQTIAQLASLRQDEVLNIVPRLERHQFLYTNTRNDLMVVSKVEL